MSLGCRRLLLRRQDQDRAQRPEAGAPRLPPPQGLQEVLHLLLRQAAQRVRLLRGQGVRRQHRGVQGARRRWRLRVLLRVP